MCPVQEGVSTILVNSSSQIFTGILHIQVKTCDGSVFNSVHSSEIHAHVEHV